MKGQTQAVTATLVTTVIIGSVATAYIWGVPLLEKRQSQANLQSTEETVIGAYDTIVSVSNGGSGTAEEVTLSPPSSDSNSNFQIKVDEEKDYIDVTTGAQNPPYPLDTWTLIRGKSLQNLTVGAGSYGIAGQDLPGVVAVRPAGGAGASIVTYRIEFRNMLVETSTGESLRRIDLESQGETRATGETTLVFSNQGTEQDAGNDKVRVDKDEELSRERTIVEVDLR